MERRKKKKRQSKKKETTTKQAISRSKTKKSLIVDVYPPSLTLINDS